LENALKLNGILGDSEIYWKNNINNSSTNNENDAENLKNNESYKKEYDNKNYINMNESNVFNSTYSNTHQSEQIHEDNNKEGNNFSKNDEMNILGNFEISEFISNIEKNWGNYNKIRIYSF
jgi:hypothetical protein